MAEYNGKFKYKDDNGEIQILNPIIPSSNVEGLGDLDSRINELSTGVQNCLQQLASKASVNSHVSIITTPAFQLYGDDLIISFSSSDNDDIKNLISPYITATDAKPCVFVGIAFTRTGVVDYSSIFPAPLTGKATFVEASQENPVSTLTFKFDDIPAGFKPIIVALGVKSNDVSMSWMSRLEYTAVLPIIQNT